MHLRIMRFLRGSLCLTWILALTLVIVACAPQSTQPSPAGPSEKEAPTGAEESDQQRPVVILQGAEIIALDPQYSQSLPDDNIHKHLFQTLTRFDEDARLVPYVAESWENTDPFTWEFKLKEGYTFHNGEPVNAEAFKFVLDRGQELFENNEGDVTYQYNLLQLAEVEVVDEYTLRVTTEIPNPILPFHMAHTQTATLAPKYYSENDFEVTNRAPVGSGPYKLVEWVPEERVVIEAWDDYKDGTPEIKTLVWRPVPEAATRIAELKAGNADIIVNVPPDLASEVDTSEGAHLETVDGMRRVFIGIKQGRHPALEDARVRQALNYAFNCEGMMGSLLEGRGTCSAHIVNAPYGSPDVTSYPYDPEKAKELLAEAGWTDSDGDGILDKDGEKLSLGFDAPNGRYIKDREIAQVIASDLEKIGIEVDFQVFDWSVYVQKAARQGEGYRDLYLLGSGPGFNCQSDLALVQATSGSNRMEYQNQQIEELWSQLNETFDEDRRVELCHQIEETAFEDAPLIFIWLQTDFYGVSDRLDWAPRPDERILLIDAQLQGN